jgi:hypothetical protein
LVSALDERKASVVIRNLFRKIFRGARYYAIATCGCILGISFAFVVFLCLRTLESLIPGMGLSIALGIILGAISIATGWAIGARFITHRIQERIPEVCQTPYERGMFCEFKKAVCFSAAILFFIITPNTLIRTPVTGCVMGGISLGACLYVYILESKLRRLNSYL